jgi:hypothetical protein
MPVVRAMGMIRETMERAGPQAVSDLWRASLPMDLARRVATWFKPLSPDQHGIAAVLTMAIGILVALSLLWIAFLG